MSGTKCVICPKALAGIRQETLSRIESGKHKAAVRSIDRIERALAKLAKGKKGR